MEYLENNTDDGQLDNGLYEFKCIKDHRGLYTSSDLNILEVVTTYLLDGKLGR